MAGAVERELSRIGELGNAALLDAVLAKAHDAILIVSADGTINYASPGTSLVFGFDRGTLVNSSIFDYVHEAEVDRAMTLFDQRLDHDEADFTRRIPVRHGSGQWLETWVSVTLLPNDSGGVAAITLRVDDESTRREASLRWRLVAEEYCTKLSVELGQARSPRAVHERMRLALGEIGLLTGASSAAVFVERRERPLLERAAHWSLLGRDAASTPDTISIVAESEAMEKILTGPTVIEDLSDAPGHFALIAGPTKSHAALSAPFAKGAFRGLVVVLRELQAHAWTDADVRFIESVANHVGSALHSTGVEQLLQVMSDTAPIGFSIRSSDGTLVDCNQEYLDLYGLTRAQAQEINFFDLIDPRDAAIIRSLGEKLVRGEISRMRHEMALADGGRSVRMNSVQLSTPTSNDTFIMTSTEDITDYRRQRQVLQHAARHDPLTGVANRSRLMETIDELSDANAALPDLLIIDLDRFKLVNDSLGHMAGDLVLRAVVDRIVDEVGSEGIVARLGGDEFAVVVPDATPEQIYAMADRVREGLERPLIVAGRSTRQTISVGVAVGHDCNDVGELLVRADRAMYAAKAKGRNQSVVFDESMRDDALARVEIERELRYAIDHGELEVHFQPEFATSNREIVGAEALVRWRHPGRGLVTAGYFIEVAEQTGMIEEVGRFALHEACRRFAEIEAETDRQLVLRINISSREFSRPELADLVRTALSDSGLAAERLCLEMTETTLMDSPELVGRTFERLHDIGVAFAIDDFGTGYSSLTYLKRYPVDALKIDRSFVEDLETDADSRAIVESIMGLAEALALEVVAEGIETEAQLELLASHGCTRGQGWLVAPALTPEDFIKLLA